MYIYIYIYIYEYKYIYIWKYAYVYLCVYLICIYTYMCIGCHRYQCPALDHWMVGRAQYEAGHESFWVMLRTGRSHIAEIRYVMSMKDSWHTYKWVMAHIWMSHVTHTNVSCSTAPWRTMEVAVTHEWVISHTWMNHVTYNEWVTSYAYPWMSRVTHSKVSPTSAPPRILSVEATEQSCHAREWVMSHTMNESRLTQISMGHVAHMNESRQTSHVNIRGETIDVWFFWMRVLCNAPKSALQHTATTLQQRCNTLQDTATTERDIWLFGGHGSATHCNALQHTAVSFVTLQRVSNTSYTQIPKNWKLYLYHKKLRVLKYNKKDLNRCQRGYLRMFAVSNVRKKWQVVRVLRLKKIGVLKYNTKHPDRYATEDISGCVSFVTHKKSEK